MNKLDKKSKRQLVLLVMLVAVAVWMFIHGQVKPMFPAPTAATEEALKQYEIVDHVGKPLDKCVQAGRVAEAYLQAHDEQGYKTWKLMQRVSCNNAGIPVQ